MRAPQTTSHNQEGFAAIIVAIVLMLVLSLITVGFAAQMRKEQRDALDNQLSAQAYYAAESGVNDALKALHDGFSDTKTGCGPLSHAVSPDLSNNIVDAAHGVSYSCLLIDPAPYSLEYGSINPTQSEVLIIRGRDANDQNNVNISQLRISWQIDNTDAGLHFRSSGDTSFPPAGAWGGQTTGILETEIVPLNSLNNTDLTNNEYTTFLYPASGAAGSPGTTTYSSNWTAKGPIVSGKCNAANNSGDMPLACNVTITGLNSSQLMLRLKAIYQNARVSVRAYSNDMAGIPVQSRIRGAQSLIDSTGKAQDVLRRLQVRVSNRDDYNYPEAAIEASDEICKLIKVYPGSYTNNCT